MDNNKMQIVNYSEKALAVLGNADAQKKCKKELKNLGGRYNPRLRDGAGWVFSRKKLGADGLKKLTALVKRNGGAVLV